MSNSKCSSSIIAIYQELPMFCQNKCHFKNTYDSMMVVFTINILLFEKFLCNFAVVTGSSLCFPKVA